MKNKYPSYRKQGVEWIEQSLTGKSKQIYQDYISFLSGTAGARKMKDYRMYTLQFIDIMEKPIYQLAPQDFVNFWALVNQDNERTVATKNSIKLTIKRFGKWYYKDNLKMRDTLESLKLKSQIVNKEKINKNNLITNKELELMIRSCKNYRDIAVLITSYESACRPHELRLAKWKDVNWDNKTISFFSTKTKEAREVPLKEAIKHLKVWRQAFQFPNVTDQDYIFPSSQDRNKPVIEWTFRNWIIEAGKRAGIKRTIYPYLLRHSRISHLKNMGVDDLDRKMFAGHSPTSKMQAVYVSMDNKDMIDSIVSKIYNVDLTPEKKKELELRVEEQQEQLNKIQKYVEEQRKANELYKLLSQCKDLEELKQKAKELKLEGKNPFL